MLSEITPALKIDRDTYKEAERELRWQLLNAQFALQREGRALLLVVSGIEGAGKGTLVQRLNEWLDPRGIKTNTYWLPSDEEESRPYFWRFWRRMPPRGEIAIFLGSWYSGVLQGSVDKPHHERLQSAAQRINFFENMMSADGALIVKLWLHLDKQDQVKQLEERAGKQQNPRVTDRPYEIHGHYDRYVEVASELMQETSTEHSPWHVIDASRRRHRELEAGRLLLAAMQQGLDEAGALPAPPAFTPATATPRLDALDLGLKLERSKYKEELKALQSRLQDLAWEAYREERSIVGVFEGWDAAGKGSAIRRVTHAIDPRLYHLVRIAAPSDEEHAHHYLWRFWRQLERDGRGTLFDRSWYGRVLVERVEGFAAPHEWQRAYQEINEFEAQLTEHGAIVLKFWLHISPEEQLARFEARKEEPHKRYKITDEDWRNREKWDQYALAVEDMLTHTDTAHAPWTLVAANDKPWARIFILRRFCEALEEALGGPS